MMAALFINRSIIVPINHFESEQNISYIIENADIDVLIVSDRFDKYTSKKKYSLPEMTKRANDRHYEYSGDMDECIDETTLILFTSGTTGKPKGVVLPLPCVFNIFEGNTARFNDFTLKVSSVYITVPLYHVMGLYYWLGSFRCGWNMYLNSEAGKILSELRSIKPNLIISTPALIQVVDTLTRNGKHDGTENLNFIISGGALLEKGMVERLKQKGIECINSYGMTETSGAGTVNFDVVGHADSIGIPMYDTEIRIIDGEICIKSGSMMKGYYKDEEATSECLIDGFMHTGDLGYIADDGYVYITGRKKNLIILSGGENVSPEELEAELRKNLLIKECVVFEKNDRIAAEVYAPDSNEDDVKNYIAELNSRLPVFKRIYSVDVSDGEFEKTANGKIKRIR
jgi:long-chain acyl-CoA synthetase